MDPTARTGGARRTPGPGRAPEPPAGSQPAPSLRDAGPLGRGALVVVLLLTAVAATALAGPWDPPMRGEDRPVPTPSVPPAPPTTRPDPLRETLEQVDAEPWDLTWLGIVLAAGLVVGLVYLAIRLIRLIPPRRGEDAPDAAGVEAAGVVRGADVAPDLDTLRDAVQGADTHLAARVPPADAVIAAWVALEEAAERSGVPRDPAATPTEFTVDVLDRTPVDPAAVRTLLALYLRARFSTDRLVAADVAAATAAVRTLAAGLARARDGAADDGAADDGAADDGAADDVPEDPRGDPS